MSCSNISKPTSLANCLAVASFLPLIISPTVIVPSGCTSTSSKNLDNISSSVTNSSTLGCLRTKSAPDVLPVVAAFSRSAFLPTQSG